MSINDREAIKKKMLLQKSGYGSYKSRYYAGLVAGGLGVLIMVGSWFATDSSVAQRAVYSAGGLVILCIALGSVRWLKKQRQEALKQ